MSRARAVALSAAGVVVAAGAGLATVGLGGGEAPTTGRGGLPPATAPVERTTLVETQQVDGTLGYGSTRTATTSGGGTVTWLPAAGTTLRRGRAAYKVDNRPVPLLYGRLPVYRTLSPGMEGPDVKQLELNLRALGYSGFTVDEEFGTATATALKDWQGDLGLPETGTLAPGSVLIAPGEIRVAERKTSVGERAGGPVFTYTGTERRVMVDLDVQYQRLAKKGAKVTIELPEGGTLEGTITNVGTVATAGQGDDPATIDVTIAVRGRTSVPYDRAPVLVKLIAERHEGVLAVPIGALLAQPSGGYAVQVVENGRTRTLPVETGVFTQGKVEISGPGLAEGMKVGVPS